MFRPLPLYAQEAAANTPADREITQVQGDLYLVRDGKEYTVFLVTPDGIILGDPLGRATALWLRDELAARFGQEVQFVLHTSHHYPRSAGSSVFNATADVVAHATFNAELAKARRRAPEPYRFDHRTSYGFGQSRLVRLGGRTVGMIHVPISATPEMAVLQFPREHVVFAARLPGIGRVPFSFGTAGPRDVFAWMEALLPLEFDTLLVGDGGVVSRAEFDELWVYLSTLRGAVTAAVREGRSAAEIRSTVTLEKMRGNPHHAGLTSQVADLHAALESKAAWLSAGPATSYGWLSSAFCASRTSCSGGGAVAGARFALSVAARQGLDVQGELTISGLTWSARTSPHVDEEAATRRSRGAVLLKWTPRPSRFSYALAGGVSITSDAVRGLDRVKGALLPTGGSHPIEQDNWRVGVTVGADLERTLGRGVVIRLPVRATRMVGGKAAFSESVLDVQAGIDVTFRLFHRVAFR